MGLVCLELFSEYLLLGLWGTGFVDKPVYVASFLGNVETNHNSIDDIVKEFGVES